MALTLGGCGGDGKPPEPPLKPVPLTLVLKPTVLDAGGGSFKVLRYMMKVIPEGGVEEEVNIDTGSATLALCNQNTDAIVKASNKLDLYSCVLYGTGELGWWGSAYVGNISAGELSSTELPAVEFAIVEGRLGGFCSGATPGIFGIANYVNNIVSAKHPDTSQWEQEPAKDRSCPADRVTKKNPLIQTLNNDQGPKYLGFWWSGGLGEGEAKIFLEDAATKAAVYSPLDKKALLRTTNGFYGMNVKSFAVDKVPVTLAFDPAQFCANAPGGCIMDTGTDALQLPTEIIKAILDDDGHLNVTTLGVTLADTNGDDGPTLTLNLKDIAAWYMKNVGAINFWPSDTGIVLGVPLWMQYYTVFELQAGTVSFSPHSFSPSSSQGDRVVV
jgi:hypothetical protein